MDDDSNYSYSCMTSSSLIRVVSCIDMPDTPLSSTQFLDSLAKDIIDNIVESIQDSMSLPNQNPFHPPKRWWNNDLSSMALAIRQQAKFVSTSNNPYIK